MAAQHGLDNLYETHDGNDALTPPEISHPLTTKPICDPMLFQEQSFPITNFLITRANTGSFPIYKDKIR